MHQKHKPFCNNFEENFALNRIFTQYLIDLFYFTFSNTSLLNSLSL
jgi:hypothetical protein